MTSYVGGLRARLIWDSLYEMLHDALDDLGWFDAGRQHSSINMISQPVSETIEIPLNTLTVVGEDITSEEIELGSLLSEHPWTFWVDFYAEDDVIGLHLIRDVKDILEGRMASISRGSPTLSVLDYTANTPSQIFVCDIENVEINRGRHTSAGVERAWYGCAFDVVDTYGGEDG